MDTAAVVRIRFVRLDLSEGLKARIEHRPDTHRVYAVGRIGRRSLGVPGQRELGRSRRIPHAEDTFAFGEERMIWEHEVAVKADEPVDVSLEILVDRLNEGPGALLLFMADVDAPWVAGEKTVVAEGSTLTYTVTTVLAPQPIVEQGDVPLHQEGGPINRVNLDVPPFVALELSLIDGLHEPVVIDYRVEKALGSPLSDAPLSKARAGYTSEDHKGRIFINRKPDGSWAKGQQYVDLTVQLWLKGYGVEARKKLKVKWTAFVPDDPSDDDPLVHRDAGSLLDPADHEDGEHLGAAGYDNEGTNAKFTDNGCVWQAMGDYTLTVGAAGDPIGVPPDTEHDNEVYLKPAVTKTLGRDKEGDFFRRDSKVRLHCPNIRGDRIIVRAELDTPGGATVLRCQTGIMSLWEKIDVEYRRMKSAFPLPIAEIPPLFEPVFVQMDFVGKADIDDKKMIPTGELDAVLADDAYFAMRDKPGWFSLVAAMTLGKQPVGAAEIVYGGLVPLRSVADADPLKYLKDEKIDAAAEVIKKRRKAFKYEYVDIPGKVAASPTVKVSWGADEAAVAVQFDKCLVENINLERYNSLRGLRQRLRLLGFATEALDEASTGEKDRKAATDFKLKHPAIQREQDILGVLKEKERTNLFARWVHYEVLRASASAKVMPAYEDLEEVARGEVSLDAFASRLWLSCHDVQNRFTAGVGIQTGRLTHAHARQLFYGPRFRETVTAGVSAGVTGDGYGAPAQATIEVKTLSGATKGYSPEATVADVIYFSGRTVVATHHSAYVRKDSDPLEHNDKFVPETIIAIVHELTHAFGMPHKCASWDRAVPRKTTCFMNYPPNWMVDDQDRLLPGTNRKIGHGWCARHIKEVRRVQLVDNAALIKRKWT